MMLLFCEEETGFSLISEKDQMIMIETLKGENRRNNAEIKTKKPKKEH